MKTKTKKPQRRRGTEKHGKCGNCYDGKLLLAGETCGVCGNHETARTAPKSQEAERRREGKAAIGCIRCTDGLTPLYCLNCANDINRNVKAAVAVGNVAIVRLNNGQLWMSHRGGEGMTIQEEKRAKVLEEFFGREF